MKKTSTIFILLLSLFLISCEGDQGPTGPQGAPGPQGPAGSVNIVTFQYTLSPGNRSVESVSTVVWARQSPEITSAINNNGVVLAYYKQPEATTWVTLPRAYELDGFVGEISYQFNTGMFYTVFIDYGGDVEDYMDFFNNHLVRVVLIPPGTTLTGLNIDDFEEVQNHFDLEFED